MKIVPSKNTTPQPSFKAFDEFASDAEYLTEEYKRLKAASDRAKETGSNNPAAAFKLIDEAIRSMGFCSGFPEKTLQEAKDFIETYYEWEEETEHYEAQLRGEISKAVALLLGSFPNTNNIPDPKVYTRLLIEEILAAEPAMAAVESACRRIRRTAKFAPSISEALSILSEEKKRWDSRFWAIWELKDLYASARKRRDELATAVSQAPRTPPAAIPVGTRVRHVKFGWGRVVNGQDQKIEVLFDNGQSRMVLASFLERDGTALEHKPQVPLDVETSAPVPCSVSPSEETDP